MNKIIKMLIMSDFVFLSSFGLITPIFAVFITQNIKGDLGVVGIASACYWIAKCLVQLPISRALDKNPAETDDYKSALWGTFAICFVPFLYLLCKHPWHLYTVESLHGIAAAFAFPGWVAIFTRHVDRQKEAYEWSAYSTLVGLGTGISAAIGGILAERFGFFVLFAVVGLASFGAIAFLIYLKKFIILSDNHRKNGNVRFKEEAEGLALRDKNS